MTINPEPRQTGGVSRSFSAAGALTLMLALSGCADFIDPPPPEACNGQPNWCLSVGNEVAHDTIVYVDGRKVAVVPGEELVKIPLAAGIAYQVNYCQERGSKILCSKPAEMTMDRNQTKIIYGANEIIY